jgi:hypothetical protein
VGGVRARSAAQIAPAIPSSSAVSTPPTFACENDGQGGEAHSSPGRSNRAHRTSWAFWRAVWAGTLRFATSAIASSGSTPHSGA